MTRTCIGCRRRAPKSDLLRVVVVEGACVPDPRGRLPGRGAHLHPDPGCFDLAVRRGAFLRALRVPGPLDLERVQAWVDLQGRSFPVDVPPTVPSPSPERHG